MFLEIGGEFLEAWVMLIVNRDYDSKLVHFNKSITSPVNYLGIVKTMLVHISTNGNNGGGEISEV